MPSYGVFETNREIGSGYASTVYSAHKTGERTDSYAIKVYALEAPATDSLASRIELQKKAAEASRHIAPILESGQNAQELWYATRLYPRSLQKIIAGHVALSRENLCHLLRSIVRGALDLKTIAGRAHGNLKPSNALIGGADKILEAEVVLSDPLPDSATEAPGYEQADLRAIGEVLLQLVRRRELTEGSDWLILPIEPSLEWTRMFGKDTPAWLALCNRLLDPNLASAGFGLRELDAELVALEPKPPISRKTLALTAAGVVLAAAAAIVFFSPSKNGKVKLTSEPTGARIYLEGQERELAKTPFKGKFPK